MTAASPRSRRLRRGLARGPGLAGSSSSSEEREEPGATSGRARASVANDDLSLKMFPINDIVVAKTSFRID